MVPIKDPNLFRPRRNVEGIPVPWVDDLRERRRWLDAYYARTSRDIDSVAGLWQTHVKWYYTRLKQLVEKEGYKSYCEFGFGSGRFLMAAWMCGFRELGGVEILPSQVKIAHEHLTAIGVPDTPEVRCFGEGLAEDPPFDDNTFDLVNLPDIVEHVPDWNKVIDEALRVAKRRVIALIPRNNSWHWSEDHIHQFRDEDGPGISVSALKADHIEVLRYEGSPPNQSWFVCEWQKGDKA